MGLFSRKSKEEKKVVKVQRMLNGLDLKFTPKGLNIAYGLSKKLDVDRLTCIVLMNIIAVFLMSRDQLKQSIAHELVSLVLDIMAKANVGITPDEIMFDIEHITPHLAGFSKGSEEDSARYGEYYLKLSVEGIEMTEPS